MSAGVSEWRSLSTQELPYRCQRRLAALLDAPHSRNWKDLLSMMPEYGAIEMQLLAGEERRGNSPTIALLKHMNSKGRRVGQLYDFASELEMKRVCELIIEGLRDRGHNVEDPDQKFSSSSHHSSGQKGLLVGAPPSPKRPSSPSAVAEVYSRYQQHTPEPGAHLISNGINSHNSLSVPVSNTPSHPEPQLSSHNHATSIIPYAFVAKATELFNEIPVSEGGHKLGQGGFGQVFYCKLKMGDHEKEVAVKAFSDKTDAETRRQFEREMHTISRLNHPNMVPLLGYSSDGIRLCLIYPYVALGSLDRHVPNPDLKSTQRILISRDVATALHYLHTACGEVLVHRDVKSANILLDPNWRAKLTDFGVARTIRMGSSTANTQTIVGTRVYMAPEYCTGVISPAADVYSFGVVLYELLCGCLAQDGPPGINDDLLSHLLDCEDVSKLFLSCWSLEEGNRIQILAEQCTSNNRYTRPTAEKVLQSL